MRQKPWQDLAAAQIVQWSSTSSKASLSGPSFAPAWRELGLAHLAVGQADDAKVAFNAGLEVARDWRELQLVKELEVTPRTEAARQVAQRSLRTRLRNYGISNNFLQRPGAESSRSAMRIKLSAAQGARSSLGIETK